MVRLIVLLVLLLPAVEAGATRGLKFSPVQRIAPAGYTGGVVEQYARALDGARLATTISGPPVPMHSYVHARNDSGESTGWTLTEGSETRAYAIGRFGPGLINAIGDDGLVAIYVSATNAPGVAACQLGDVRAEYQWDRYGTQLTNLVWKVNDTAIASFAQTYPTNGVHRIERRERLDGSHWDYLYDGSGRLTNAVLRAAGGAPVPGGRYAYEWDDAGNPIQGGPVDGDEPRWSYDHNTGNLQVRRVWGNKVEILGEAAADAAVGVSLGGGAYAVAERQGERYRFLGTVPGLDAEAMDLAVEIVAVRQEGPNEIVQRAQGRLFLPKADETVAIDVAGRLHETSRWIYTWNLRGQLMRAESRHRTPNVRLDYDYYPSGPMARRIRSEWVNGAWTAAVTNQWIVDGWRPVKEIESTATSTVTRRYTWGLDLAGVRDHESLEAFGGIGGLLAIREREDSGPETTRYVISDPQGNVMALADPAGTLVARFDYDPFGRLIMETGEASSCPFRYSTKYRDPELELYCYGHRWYDPASMKWLTPDPIGERGGVNLTAFCANDPVNKVDPLGLELIVPGRMDSPASGKTWLISDEIAADLGLSGLNGADGDRVAYIDVEWTSISVLKDAAFRNATEDEKARMEFIRAIEARMEEVSRHRNAYLRSWEQGAPLYMVAAPYRGLEAEYDWLYHLRRDVVYEGRPIARFFVNGGDDPWFVAGMMSTTYNGVRLTYRGIRSWRAARAAPKTPMTVIGSLDDVAKFKGKPGYNVLDVPDAIYKKMSPAEFDRLNAEWLNASLQRGERIMPVTHPAAHAQFLESIRPGLSIQSRYLNLELPMLKEFGVRVP